MPVAGIIGTSIGAMIGAAFAGGCPVEEMEAVARSLRRRDMIRLNRKAVWINGMRAESVFRGPLSGSSFERCFPRTAGASFKFRWS